MDWRNEREEVLMCVYIGFLSLLGEVPEDFELFCGVDEYAWMVCLLRDIYRVTSLGHDFKPECSSSGDVAPWKRCTNKADMTNRVASVSSSVFVMTSLIEAIIDVKDATYTFNNWQYTLIMIVFRLVTMACNTWGALGY